MWQNIFGAAYSSKCEEELGSKEGVSFSVSEWTDEGIHTVIRDDLVNDQSISLGIFEWTDEGLGISECASESILGKYE